MKKSTAILYITLFLFLLGIVLTIIIFTVKSRGGSAALPTPPEQISETPTATPVLPPQTSLEDVVNQIHNKQPLGATDESVRQSLIAQAGAQGVISKTDTYLFDYSPDVSVFHIEILTSNVDAALNNAIAWLRSQGLSDQGICNLPVVAFRDPKRFDPSLTTGMEFYPLPVQCQK